MGGLLLLPGLSLVLLGLILVALPLAEARLREETPLVLRGQGRLPEAKPIPSEPSPPFWVSLASLGQATVGLQGMLSEGTIFLPIPPGFYAQAIELYLEASPLLPEGYLSLWEGERLLAQTPLSRGKSQIRLPLGSKGQKGFLPLRFRMVLRGEEFCRAALLHEVRILPQSRLLLEGRVQAPQNLSEFFPTYLREVHYIHPVPLEEQAAEIALWLAAYLGRRYPAQPPHLRLHPEGKEPRAEGPFVRRVRYRPGVGAGLEGHTLLLGDRAQAMRLLLSEIPPAPLPSEAVREVVLIPEELGPLMPLSALGYRPETRSGLGTLEFNYSFALADLGSHQRPLGLRLKAEHTPVEKGRAQALLLLNGALLASLPLEGSRLSVWVPIPEHLLERNNNLAIRFQYAPNEDQCRNGSLPFTVTVDPTSSLTLGRGSPLRGLEAFPQALLPRFGVYLSSLDTPQLELALRLIKALQATTRTPLRPFLSRSAEGSPLLAVGGPALAQTLRSPLQGPFRLEDKQGRAYLEALPGSPYAALLSPRPGVLLLAHYGESEGILDHFLKGLLKEGWYGVRGDIALGGPMGEPVSFRLQDSDLRINLLETPQSFLARYRREIYLVLAGFFLIVLGIVYPRVVRK